MNQGPRQIAARLNDPEIQRTHQEANTYLNNVLRRNFPDYMDHCHYMLGGITYNFYSHRTVVNTPIQNGSVDSSVREVRDDLFEREDDEQDQLFRFHLRDGSLAVRIQVFNLTEPLGLIDMPAAIRLYRTFYYYRTEHPIHATVTIVTQSPAQVLGLNNGPVY